MNRRTHRKVLRHQRQRNNLNEALSSSYSFRWKSIPPMGVAVASPTWELCAQTMIFSSSRTSHAHPASLSQPIQWNVLLINPKELSGVRPKSQDGCHHMLVTCIPQVHQGNTQKELNCSAACYKYTTESRPKFQLARDPGGSSRCLE